MDVAASFVKAQLIMTVFFKQVIAVIVCQKKLKTVRSGDVMHEWTYTKTGKVFLGNQYEAMDYFELPQNTFRKLRKAGLIQMRHISVDEIELEEFVKNKKLILQKKKGFEEKLKENIIYDLHKRLNRRIDFKVQNVLFYRRNET